MPVRIPHPDRGVIGRIEISRCNGGSFLTFVGNAHGTCGYQKWIREDELSVFLEKAAKAVMSWEEIK